MASACLPWGTKLHITLPESDRSQPVESNSENLNRHVYKKSSTKTNQSSPVHVITNLKGTISSQSNQLKKGTKRPQTKRTPIWSVQKQTQLKASACLHWGIKLHITFSKRSSKPGESNRGKLNSLVYKKSITQQVNQSPVHVIINSKSTVSSQLQWIKTQQRQQSTQNLNS